MIAFRHRGIVLSALVLLGILAVVKPLFHPSAVTRVETLELVSTSGTATTMQVQAYDGNPNGVISGPIGSVIADTSGTGALWQNTDGATSWATIGGITNTAGLNVIMKSDGTNAVPSTITDNGSTIVSIGELTTQFGSTVGAMYIQGGGFAELDSGYNDTTDTYTLYINRNGRLGSTTHYRNTVIENGKRNPILSLTGSTNAAVFSGPVEVDGTFTLTSGGPTWTTASGAPSGACTTGSLYSNISGASGTTLYVCEAGSWTAK